MPLPLPVLDDRTYQDLLDELRARIPVDAPQWTDHNASDPGITLLELFAYLGDMSLYRLDRVPDRLYRAFLRLIGCSPGNARIAAAPVQFTLTPAAAPVDLPPGVQLASDKGDIVFETGTSFHVSDAKLQVTLSSCGSRLIDRTRQNTTLQTFRPFGEQPQPGDALYLGFDKSLGEAGTHIRLFVFGDSTAADWQTWCRLREEWAHASADSTEACSRACECSQHKRPWQHYGVRLAWEFYAGNNWTVLPGVRDFTRALSLSGPVRWQSPPAGMHQPGGLTGYDSLFFIRCRVLEGKYDCPPLIRAVRANTVIARHAADIGTVVSLGRGTGRASQQFRLPRVPVVPGSTQLTLANAQGVVKKVWRERADFDRSGSHARDYVLSATTGDVTFGDGREGRVLAADIALSAKWKVGGGATGNIPAGTLGKLPLDGINLGNGALTFRPDLQVVQPIDAFGGVDSESLAATQARGFQKMNDDRCAATLSDLGKIASATPGVPVAFAYAVAEHHPQLGCLPAAGCVTVVIVPQCVKLNRDPTPAMCAAVAAFIAPRRPVALEVHVTGPRYTVVAVTATLVLRRNVDRTSVLAQAVASLDQFLDPLSGGPNNSGWPVGRSVYRSEILAQLDAIPGVDYVADLTLSADQATPARCGEIVICPDGLVISGQHQVSATEGTRT